MVYKLGWFSTGRGPGSRNLLRTVFDNIHSGNIPAEISFVFCNREEGEAEGSDLFLRMVRDYGLPLITFSSKKFHPEIRKKGKENPQLLRQWRLAYDREIMNRLSAYQVNTSMLAGYMLIVGDEMCESYDLINLHPAAPHGPQGTWQDVIWKLIEQRASQSGVTIHLVTKQLDRGPCLTYCTFPINDCLIHPLWLRLERRLQETTLQEIIKEEGEYNELFQEIRRRGVLRELPLIVHTLKLLSEEKICIKNKQLLVDGQPQASPLCLNEPIEGYIKQHPLC